MSRRERDDDGFGDAVYEAWRSGLNPDHVDRDRLRDYRDELGSRELAVEAEVEYLARRRRRADEARAEAAEQDALREMGDERGTW